MATGTPGSTARKNALQLVHYLRFTVNFNDTGIATGVGKQWLPAGAMIIGTDVNISTAFNAGTTNALTVGIERRDLRQYRVGGDRRRDRRPA